MVYQKAARLKLESLTRRAFCCHSLCCGQLVRAGVRGRWPTGVFWWTFLLVGKDNSDGGGNPLEADTDVGLDKSPAVASAGGAGGGGAASFAVSEAAKAKVAVAIYRG